MLYKNFNEIEIMTKSKYSTINKIFKNLNAYLKISHMAIIVITPDKKVFLASSSSEFTENFSKLGYHRFVRRISGFTLLYTVATKRDEIDQECFKTQQKIFGTILEGTWQNYRTRETTELQLKSAEFNKIKFYWDSRKIFYSFKAEKSNMSVGDNQQYDNNISLKF